MFGHSQCYLLGYFVKRFISQIGGSQTRLSKLFGHSQGYLSLHLSQGGCSLFASEPGGVLPSLKIQGGQPRGDFKMHIFRAAPAAG